MMLVQGDKEDADYVITYMRRILKDTIDECLDEQKIFDGNVDSLYATVAPEVNRIVSGG